MAFFDRPRPIVAIILCACCVGSVLTLLPETTAAQVLYGTLVGNVKDASGAVIPGATVAATNVGTNQTFEGVTNDAGQYTLRNLQAGSYTVKVSLQGFKEYVENNVTITANNVTRVDVALQVGAPSEMVTVTAEAVQLQADKADVHKDLSSTELANLPMTIYRNYQSLIDLVPGTTPSYGQGDPIDTGTRSLITEVNGVNSRYNATRTDGAVNVQPWQPQYNMYVSSEESIQTVNVTTNNFDAEQGMAGGAAVTVQTKSGTNAFHGVVFEYDRNSAFSAANFFTPQGSSAPKYLLNQYGGNLGGPIKKDKLFFFANFEATRDRENASQLFTVATPAMKTGDLSATGTKIYDPATGDSTGKGRTTFTNGIIPASRISSVATKMLALSPAPNVPNAGFTSNFFSSTPWVFDRNMYDLKVDWVRTTKNTIWFKYSIMNSWVNSQYALGAAGGPANPSTSGPGHSDTRVQVGTLGGYYAITPKLLIDGTISYSRYVIAAEQQDFGTNFGLDVLGIPGTNGPDIRQSGKPKFDISGYTVLGQSDGWIPLYRHDYTMTYSGNVNWNKGKHDIRFGPDVSRFGMNHWQPEAGNGPRGYFQFNGGASALNGGTSPNRFNGMADFLLGAAQGVQKTLQFYTPMSCREWQIAMYFRDRWQVTNNLTLSLGLRWELYPLMDRGFHGIERYDPDTNKVYIGGYGGVDWNADTTVSKKLFAPRFGLAYRLGKQGVLRAGYGITYDPYDMSRPMRAPYPAVIPMSLQGPSSFIPYENVLSGIPPFETPDITKGVIDIPNTYTTSAMPKGLFRRGYIQSFNFIYERSLPFNLVWSVGYVATRSVRIVASSGSWPINNSPVGTGQAGRPLNQKFGRSVSTSILQPWANARYNSLQTTLERRFTAGLMLKTVYTWGHSIDVTTSPHGMPDQFYLNRGSSDWDRRHNFRTAVVYQLPWGPGKRWAKAGFAGALVGGWQMSAIFSAVTGTPFTVGTSSASLNAPGSSQVADQVLPEIKKLGNIGVGVPFFDPNAFRPVTQVRFGNSGRNILCGPGLVNLDLGVFRAFKIREGKELTFRAESFNLTNTPHFNNPSASASDATFNADGTLKSSGNFMSVVSAAQDQRTLRFGIRFSF